MKKTSILLLLFVAGCQLPEGKDFTEINYRIAYNVWEDQEGDNYEVYSMNVDGSDSRNITNLNGVEWTYHATGPDLLFISDMDTCHRCYQLYTSDAFGNKVQKIGGYLLKDSWQSTRKKGQEIIINPKVENDRAFYIINRSGDLVKKVYPGLAYFSDPSFSPDGTQIVFRGSNKRFKAEIGYQDELYIINEEGNSLRQLTYYPEGDTTAAWWQYHAGPPSWETTRNIITYHSVQQEGSFLFQINPDGTGLKRITPDSIKVGWHSWSSDGKMVVFDAETKTDNGEVNYDIFIMEYETGEIKQLTNDSRYEQSPVFVEVEK